MRFENYENLWAIDIETGGLEIGLPVIEVAYGPVFSDDLTVLWNMDADPTKCESRALEINRCFDADRPHAPQEERLRDWQVAVRCGLDLHQKVLVASNPQFDSGHLAAMLKQHGYKETWSYRLVDLKSLVVGWAAAKGNLRIMPDRGWGQHDVARLVEVPEISPELLHTAAGDVEQLRQIVRAVLDGP